MTSLKKVSWVLLLALVVGAAVTFRAVWAGERELAKSTEALRAGDADEAIVRARGAAYWYVPGAPHVRVAYARLMAIAKEAERRKLWPTALFAYRAVVTASASTRWIRTPHAAEADEARAAIASIEARTGTRPPLTSADSVETIEKEQLTALSENIGPNRFFTAILAASFVAMIAGLAAFLRLGLDESGRMRAKGAVPALVAAGAGIVGYCVALFLA